jgi:hypothetical protein
VKLTADEIDTVTQWDQDFKAGLEAIAQAQADLELFQVGEVYIREATHLGGTKKIVTTGVGTPIKYIVVHKTESGLPILKQLNVRGEGQELMMPESLEAIFNLHYPDVRGVYREKWQVDPDKIDALLIGEENYNPVAAQQERQELANEVKKHNKLVRIDTKTNFFVSGQGEKKARANIVDFFKSLKTGDKFWTSHSIYFIFQSFGHAGVNNITAIDANGKVIKTSTTHWLNRHLYRDQPRSFKKEAVAAGFS